MKHSKRHFDIVIDTDSASRDVHASGDGPSNGCEIWVER